MIKTSTGNMIYSPFSIHVIIFMASVGADSKTFEEMIAAIHLSKSNYSLEAYSDLLEDLTVKYITYISKFSSLFFPCI